MGLVQVLKLENKNQHFSRSPTVSNLKTQEESVFESQARKKSLLLMGESAFFVPVRPSTAWMRPTTFRACHLLYVVYQFKC